MGITVFLMFLLKF